MDKLKRGDTRDSPDGKTVFWQYSKKCKNGEYWVTPEVFEEKAQCAVDYQAEYRKSNREQKLEYNTKYYQDNREKIAEYSTKYYRDNREQLRESQAEYRKNNSALINALNSKRRAAQLQRTPQWSLDNLGIQFELECIYKYCAALNALGLNYHVDHIVPLQGENVSGLHLPWNLQVIPAIENVSKKNKFDTDTYIHTLI